MIITKKALPRRTFLRGLQATLALPLLDAMIPAATAWAKTPAQPVRRLGYVFIPMGCDHARWIPTGQGALTELSPSLSPLESLRDQLTVVTNLELENSYPGTHDTSNSGFLSAAFAKHTESSDYHLGTTADQLAAKQIGQETQLPSLELSMDVDPLAGRVQQRLCLRLHEFLVLVITDGPAPLRGASPDRLRASLWRGRHPRGAACGAQKSGQSARLVQ